MDDKRRCADLSEHRMRLEPEDLVEDGPTMLQRRRELDISVLTELLRHFVAQIVVGPVRSAVNGALLVVELGAEQNETGDLLGTLGCVVAADTTAEALANQAQPCRAGNLAGVGQRHSDVVENR